jgi:hypothetical protein
VAGPFEHPIEWLTTHIFAFTGEEQGEEMFYQLDDYRRLAGARSRTMEINPAGTEIGHDVWIGAGAFIKRGVKIGNGAIVAANAAVTRDVAPYAIVGGVPAKTLRLRFSEALVERLIKLAWWRYDIAPFKDRLDFSDPAAAVELIEGWTTSGALKPLQPPSYRLTRTAEGFAVESIPSPFADFGPEPEGA